MAVAEGDRIVVAVEGAHRIAVAVAEVIKS